jgi:hypothetical protein
MNMKEETYRVQRSSDQVGLVLNTVYVPRRHYLRALAESTDQLLERFGVWLRVNCLTAGA